MRLQGVHGVVQQYPYRVDHPVVPWTQSFLPFIVVFVSSLRDANATKHQSSSLARTRNAWLHTFARPYCVDYVRLITSFCLTNMLQWMRDTFSSRSSVCSIRNLLRQFVIKSC